MKANREILVRCLVAFFSASCISCGYKVTYVAATNMVYPAKADTYDMPVFYEAPSREYVIIAQIFAYPQSKLVTDIQNKKALLAVKKKAIELGADALLIDIPTAMPNTGVGIGGYSGGARAIHWKE